MTPTKNESLPELPFTVRCPQCGEKFKSSTNIANLCIACECAEYDIMEPTDA
jgi:uncharacterized protein (DUF983 family)